MPLHQSNGKPLQWLVTCTLVMMDSHPTSVFSHYHHAAWIRRGTSPLLPNYHQTLEFMDREKDREEYFKLLTFHNSSLFFFFSVRCSLIPTMHRPTWLLHQRRCYRCSVCGPRPSSPAASGHCCSSYQIWHITVKHSLNTQCGWPLLLNPIFIFKDKRKTSENNISAYFEKI